ncbi:hypothetical protein C8J57DRAFT_1244124 [Mycena rebaudengoi]|nr:hypothetical protein C8J57DRAFT_1244124 [Mycena rebaudengoi]
MPQSASGLLYFQLNAPTEKRGISKEEQAALKLAALRPLLYGRIVVADSGQTLVQSLASNKELPPMVHSILFLPSALVIEGPMWERVLCDLTNLTQLGISGHTRLTRSGLDEISFKLLSFISFSNCPPVWANLLQLQLRLEVLEIRGDLLGPTPFLPAIRSVCLNPSVAAKMLEHNRLPDIEFFLQNLADQSITWKTVPTFLKELRSLVFDSDPSWVRTSIQELLAYTLHSTAIRLLAMDLPQLRKVRFVSTYCHPYVSELVKLLHTRWGIQWGLVATWVAEDWTIISVGGIQEVGVLFCGCQGSSTHAYHLMHAGAPYIGLGRSHWAIAGWNFEQDPMPLEPETDWYTRCLNARRVRRLQHLEDLRLATPYVRPGPETHLEEDWRLSMQNLANFAEETVAEQEQDWQNAFQSIADWHIENFRPPRIPRIGTQAYFEFVRNRRERFTFTEDRVAQAVHRREHERLLESGYRPVTDAEGLHRAWASVNPLANGRHDFLRAHGIGNLQYGERYNVFS